MRPDLGPASNWLGLHTTRGWQYDKGLQLGMRNTRDLIVRSEGCLSCHLGDETRSRTRIELARSAHHPRMAVRQRTATGYAQHARSDRSQRRLPILSPWG